MTDETYPDALPNGYRLHWYVLERVLGQGGFGITYLARDSNLDRPVAIKEYLPSEIARRRSDATAHPRTESHGERFRWGLDRFLAEARTLARFDHPNIVRVHSVFEANNTAYMVMRFEEGENLATLLDRCGTQDERQLMQWLQPVLDGLQLVHSSGFIHRDIKPENIYLREDGCPVLLDFGSARKSFGNARTMTALVAPGYAPLEQYYGDAAAQGAWTDIYGLGATCYRAITGQPPLDAIVRAKGVLGSAREVLPAAADVGRGRYGEAFLAAIDHALQLSERDRPQDIVAWRRELFAQATLAAASAPSFPSLPIVAQQQAATSAAVVSPSRPSPAHTGSRWAAAAAAATAALVAVVAWTTRGSPPLVADVPASSAGTAALPVVPSAAATGSAIDPAAAAQDKPLRAEVPSAAPLPAPIVAQPAPRVAERRDPLPQSTPSRSPMPASALAMPSSPAAALVSAPAPAPAPLPALAQASAAPFRPVVMPPPVVARLDAPPAADQERFDVAEAALRNGDHGTAAQVLRPLAAAGQARAQALLGRVLEDSAGRQHSDLEAYVWLSIAARSGDGSAASLRNRVAARLQPAELRQADKLIENWRPRAEPGASPVSP